ncbi:MAG: flagellar protein [Chloroflexi bacterium]|nr:flagellar protein [Chloroflexota bacterium]
MANNVPIDPNLRVQLANGIRPAPAKAADGDQSFAQALDQAQQGGVKFSNHAQKRLQSREIQMAGDGMNRLVEAVEKAETRGGKESLVLMDDLAFIVNVPERTVVTAIDTQKGGEGVFTQIDSVVLAK